MKKNIFIFKLAILSIISFGILAIGCNSNNNNNSNNNDNNNNNNNNSSINKATVISERDSQNISTDDPSTFVSSDSLNLNDDFITGVDISSIISLEESGVTFYDENNNECDIFKLLSDNGVNCIRVRIFNDPYDEKHNTYGGGHNDLTTALDIGKRASAYNIPLYLDFHYSDFWADPKKQQVPKAWSDMSFSEKEQAIYDYTMESLAMFIDNNISVKMVQIGNETNYHFCGETDWDNICTLLSAGISAVRQVAATNNLQIETALHFTNPEILNNYSSIAAALYERNVDYDIFATSYYPYWHGTLSNLNTVLSDICANYHKKVLVAETAYPYTFNDSDCFTNNVNADNYTDITYDISPEGQYSFIYDLAKTLNSISDCIGFFYWEPAWIAVGDSYNDNLNKWEKFGSGWATSFAGSYDESDAGKYYGGSSWDNQALFDPSGKPLPSFGIFKDIR